MKIKSNGIQGVSILDLLPQSCKSFRREGDDKRLHVAEFIRVLAESSMRSANHVAYLLEPRWLADLPSRFIIEDDAGGSTTEKTRAPQDNQGGNFRPDLRFSRAGCAGIGKTRSHRRL
jgi:hypothetical protein